MPNRHEWVHSSSPLFEISSKKSINGRREFKAALHEIHPDKEHYQHNGISWNEDYVKANMDSVIGMSIVAEFITEDRDIPYGHGMTGVKDNMPLFEDATMVGHFSNTYIDEVEIDGETKKVLIAEGTLDEMRYPKFVEWLIKHMSESQIKGSVEIVGKRENDGVIIYSDGWVEKGRVPQVYDYSGYAILSVKPADEAAIVMELNNNKSKESKGETVMDEAMKKEIQAASASALAETNCKWEQYAAQVQAKDAEISQLQADIASKKADIADKVAEIEQLRADYDAANAKLALAEAGLAEANEKIVEMEKSKRKSELNEALAAFSEDERSYAKSEIESFEKDPTSVEISSITGKIYEGIGRKSREGKTSEINSEIDIFGMSDDPSAKTEDEIDIFSGR